MAVAKREGIFYFFLISMSRYKYIGDDPGGFCRSDFIDQLQRLARVRLSKAAMAVGLVWTTLSGLGNCTSSAHHYQDTPTRIGTVKLEELKDWLGMKKKKDEAGDFLKSRPPPQSDSQLRARQFEPKGSTGSTPVQRSNHFQNETVPTNDSIPTNK